MRKPLVAGNWKMNGSLAANAGLLQAIRDGVGAFAASEVVVCPPVVYLPQVQAALAGSRVGWGAQDASPHGSGAYTGEISAAMLRDFGCSYVIVGHSERRTLHAEPDSLVADKAAAVLGAGMTPIVCVGETLAEREAGKTLAVVGRQLSAVIDRLGAVAIGNVVLAYEPVWAIGTGRTASPAQAQEVHAAIRSQLRGVRGEAGDSVRVLYGGSVKPDNAKEIFSMPDVDGGLIGGASLSAADFSAICLAAEQIG